MESKKAAVNRMLATMAEMRKQFNTLQEQFDAFVDLHEDDDDPDYTLDMGDEFMDVGLVMDVLDKDIQHIQSSL